MNKEGVDSHIFPTLQGMWEEKGEKLQCSKV